jgi:hypothetical protein
MKIASRIFSLLLIAGVATLFGCGGDDKKDKTEQEVQIEALNGTWQANTVTFNGGTPALDHSNFIITITGTSQLSYSITGRPTGPSAWPSSGTFTFGPNVKEDLIREDEVAISYSVSGNNLVMDFTFDDEAYTAGRVSSVSGQWHFEFTKQTN